MTRLVSRQTAQELRAFSPDTRVSAVISGRAKKRDDKERAIRNELWIEYAGEECARIAAKGVRHA